MITKFFDLLILDLKGLFVEAIIILSLMIVVSLSWDAFYLDQIIDLSPRQISGLIFIARVINNKYLPQMGDLGLRRQDINE